VIKKETKKSPKPKIEQNQQNEEHVEQVSTTEFDPTLLILPDLEIENSAIQQQQLPDINTDLLENVNDTDEDDDAFDEPTPPPPPPPNQPPSPSLSLIVDYESLPEIEPT
jgi:hypothetical protein